MPDINDIIDWENGQMDEEREERFFQQLVDTGLAWSLQGTYGRRAKELIQMGAIKG